MVLKREDPAELQNLKKGLKEDKKIREAVRKGEGKKLIKKPKEKSMEVTKEEAIKVNKDLARLRESQKKVEKKTKSKEPKTRKHPHIELYIEPVLNDDGKPCWLTRAHKTAPCYVEDDEPIEEIVKDTAPIEEVIVFDLTPECMWQCVKCGAVMESNPDEPLECYEEKGGCGRKTRFKPMTESINPDLWKLPKWKDIAIEDLSMIEVHDDIVSLLKRCLVLPEEIHYRVIALWIMSTWKTGRWRTVGFPVFLGERDTGKTTALDLIRELGYRMIHASGTTFPAMVRATHYHHAGMLVDEASDRLDRKTESGREMLDFIKPSYRIGSKYTAADKEDQKKILSYRNFGFKAFAGERSFTVSLLSRSLVFIMEKDYPEVAGLTYVQDELDDIQTKLLNYRYKFNDPPDLGEDFELRGRTREIFESIIATGMHVGVDVEDIINFARRREEEQEEEMQATLEWDILKAVKELQQGETQYKLEGGYDSPEYVSFNDLRLNIFGEIEDAQDRKKKQVSKLVMLLNDYS